MSLLSKATSKPKDSQVDLEEIKKLGLKNYIEKLEGEITKVLQANDDKVRKTLADLKLSNNIYRILDNVKAQESQHA